MKKKLDLYDEFVVYSTNMYTQELIILLEKVLNKSYQMKNGEHAFYCPFCHHHKKKLQINLKTQKWHCWVCNKGGHKIGILLRKINAPKQIISEVLKILGDYIGVSKEKDEKTEYDVGESCTDDETAELNESI